jgi:3-methyl-2-oxobutanoate hydroxymethyltransferase
MSTLSLSVFTAKKSRHERLAMVTAYDAPSARLAASAGIDALLVGDSAAVTHLGRDSTIAITVNELLVLAGAVRRGAPHVPVVADLPFGAYQVSDEHAVRNAVRFVKESGADAVKLERGGPNLRRVAAIVGAGIPVMGHIGITPQSVCRRDGYRIQGRTTRGARQLVDEAHDLEKAGCFAIVLEAIAEPVAAAITERLTIPTIGIGAGLACDGQVLVWHDLLGLTEGHVPRFVKQYARLEYETVKALESYIADVRAGRFPAPEHCYAMQSDEQELFASAATASTVQLPKR